MECAWAAGFTCSPSTGRAGDLLLREADRGNNSLRVALFAGKARYLPFLTDVAASLWGPLPVWLISSKMPDVEYKNSFGFDLFSCRIRVGLTFVKIPVVWVISSRDPQGAEISASLRV